MADGHTPEIRKDARLRIRVQRMTVTAHQFENNEEPSLIFSVKSKAIKDVRESILLGSHDGEAEKPAFSSFIGFDSKMLSKTHCKFTYYYGRWWIKDLKSTWGTFVNGERLSPERIESGLWGVKSGDVIQLGSSLEGETREEFRPERMELRFETVD